MVALVNRSLPATPAWRRLPTQFYPLSAPVGLLWRLALPSIIGGGFALRLGLLSAFPLREDEAIYGYWARAFVQDPFFLQVWPDKPPLFLWLLAGMFGLLGPSAEAARWLNIVAATLTIPLVAAGATTLWQSRRAGVIAALIFALNPYAISFAPTAYTDTLLVLWGTAAVVAALRGRGLAAGCLLAAAVMTKQQGLLYLPLVGLLLLLPMPDMRNALRRLGSLLIGAALVVGPILWWDSRRWAVAPSPWDLAQRTYAPLTWAAPSTWLARLDNWGEWLWYLGGGAFVWGWMLAASLAALWMMCRCAVIVPGRGPHPNSSPGANLCLQMTPPQPSPTGEGADRCRPQDAGLLPLGGELEKGVVNRPALLTLLLWSMAFLALHTVTTVQIWDRYLLLLAPVPAWIVAGPLARTLGFAPTSLWRRVAPWLVWVALLAMLRPALAAAQGQLPIGGDHGDYRGLVEAIHWVEQEHVGPALLYHQALGWHLRFYLYDEFRPQGNNPPRIDLRWFPSATYLADNAAKQPYPPKYLIAPEWATPRDLALQLSLRGLALETRLRSGRFVVYAVVQPPRPPCGWCVTHAPWQPTVRVAPDSAWTDAP